MCEWSWMGTKPSGGTDTYGSSSLSGGTSTGQSSGGTAVAIPPPRQSALRDLPVDEATLTNLATFEIWNTFQGPPPDTENMDVDPADLVQFYQQLRNEYQLQHNFSRL